MRIANCFFFILFIFKNNSINSLKIIKNLRTPYLLLLLFRFFKQKNLFYSFRFFFCFTIFTKIFNLNFFKICVVGNSLKFWTQIYIKFKLKTGFLKKSNNVRHVYFYKIYQKNKLSNLKFFKKIKQFNNFKLVDYKRKFFFTLRENRSIIKTLFLNSFVKQKKITKFLLNFKNNSVKKNIVIFELSLFNILIQSTFVIYKKDVFFFLKSGFVFVNGAVQKNPYFLLKPNDRVQLIINKNYYYYFRLLKYVLKRMLTKIRKKIIQKSKKTFSLYKQRSYSMPGWVLKMLYYKTSTPKYLEVNFQILTIIIIRYPLNIFEFNFAFLKFISFFNLRLYNWRKLT